MVDELISFLRHSLKHVPEGNLVTGMEIAVQSSSTTTTPRLSYLKGLLLYYEVQVLGVIDFVLAPLHVPEGTLYPAWKWRYRVVAAPQQCPAYHI